MDSRKVDLVLQYALAVAGEEEYDRQELGPIHLLKYVYLADLAHAENEDGTTFTGARWRFHHFGPWAPEVHQRIQPAVQAIGASERRFASPYGDDAVRWRVRDRGLVDRIEAKLPGSVARAVKRAVHEFASDTTALLHSVYKTVPMLRAAPGEDLEFQAFVKDAGRGAVPAEAAPESPKLKTLSKTALSKLRGRVAERTQKARDTKARTLVAPQPSPRYDEVFSQGQDWLDGLAGDAITPQSGRLSFSEAIWKSDSRGETKLP